MTSLLLNIKPELIVKILNEEKTKEIRKNCPKCKTPFKVYMYCNRGERILFKDWIDPPFVTKEYNLFKSKNFDYNVFNDKRTWGNANEKIVGEFICNKIERISCDDISDSERLKKFLSGSSMSVQQFKEYAIEKSSSKKLIIRPKFKDMYSWDISDLKIYEEPKELQDFKPPYPFNNHCNKCEINKNNPIKGYNEEYCSSCIFYKYTITKPPQTYCFVEDLEG